MTNCAMDKDILILAANRELSLIQRGRVIIHIRQCSDCRKLFLEYKKMSALMKELPEYQASEHVSRNIDEKTGMKSGEPSVLEDLLSVLFYGPVKYAGATAVLVIILTLVWFRTNITDSGMPKTEHYYSTTEISAANLKTKEALAILGKFLNRTQAQLGSEILGEKVSKPLNKGINTVTDIFKKEHQNENN